MKLEAENEARQELGSGRAFGVHQMTEPVSDEALAMADGRSTPGISGRTVDLLLNAAFGGPTTIARFEGLCIGDPLTVVSGAVVCYAPTIEILRRAVAARRNLILTREHPFFLHGGLNWAYTSEDLLPADSVTALTPAGSRDVYRQVASLEGDAVTTAKRKIIADGALTVYRQGAAWDQYRPAAQSAALARALGMVVPSEQESSRRRGVVCDLGHVSPVLALARLARERLGCTSPRIVGDGELTVRRAAVLAGETDPVPALAELLSDPSIDCIIAGAGGISDEVDGGIAYFLDLLGTGRRLVMLTVGFGPSHEPGVREMTEAIRHVLPDLDLEYWSSEDPAWTPRHHERPHR